MNNELVLHEEPWFPSCHFWQEAERKNVITDGSEVYGSLLKDSIPQLRKKFAMLTLGSPLFIPLIRIPSRIQSLVFGDFVTTGLAKAKQEFELERQQWSQGKVQYFPTEKRRLFLQSKHIFIQLVKNVAKIVFYPLAAVALFFTALYGVIFNPWDARVYFGKIEWLFARDLPDLADISHDRSFNSEFIAACMQPQSVAEEYNFPQRKLGYNVNTIRSRLNQALRAFKKDREFWINEGIDVEAVINRIKSCQKKVANISFQDCANLRIKPDDFAKVEAEVVRYPENNKFNIHFNQTVCQRGISAALFGIIDNLQEIKRLRNEQTTQIDSEALKLKKTKYNQTWQQLYELWKTRDSNEHTPWIEVEIRS